MSQAAINTAHFDVDQVRWMLDVLEERDLRICALLHAIRDCIPAETYDCALHGLALQTAEDQTAWCRLREALGLPATDSHGGKA